jgi:hypothetical protein
MAILRCHIASLADTRAAAAACIASLRTDSRPDLLITFYGECHDDGLIRAALESAWPGTPCIGGTSSGGVIGVDRVPMPTDLGMLAIYDAGGTYGVGAAIIDECPALAAQTALESALGSCGSEGLLPELVWVFQPPGSEEEVIQGLQRVIGDRCPVIGGSAGDDTVKGRWRVLAPGMSGANVIAVAALFPGTPTSSVFQSGYAPTPLMGTVTRSNGRKIVSIDGKPAGDVYQAWRGDDLLERQAREGSILAATALAPIGVPSRSVAGVTQYQLVHPAMISSDGGLQTFAAVPEGATIKLMSGNPERLALRAGRVLDDAVAMLPDPDGFAGALLVFCAGCAMSLGEGMQQLGAAVGAAARGRPVIGVLTFGEQGVLGDKCVHGNLMVSAVAFSRGGQ